MWLNVYQTITNYISMIKITDILDILIVAYIIYKVLAFIRDTRAIQLLKGIGILLVVMQISLMIGLHAVNFLLRNAMQLGVLAILIVFQPEFRRALEQMGRSSVSKWFNLEEQNQQSVKSQVITEIVRAAESLSKTKTGGLIVIERETKIGDIIGTGIMLNADVSAELLINIFEPKTPLHDGAVVLRSNKIQAAACFLPLSQNPNLSKELGTRHRAGLGISEDTDALVVVISEETGRISVAIDGDLKVGLNNESLLKLLTKIFETQNYKRFKKSILLRKEKRK